MAHYHPRGGTNPTTVANTWLPELLEDTRWPLKMSDISWYQSWWHHTTSHFESCPMDIGHWTLSIPITSLPVPIRGLWTYWDLPKKRILVFNIEYFKGTSWIFNCRLLEILNSTMEYFEFRIFTISDWRHWIFNWKYWGVVGGLGPGHPVEGFVRLLLKRRATYCAANTTRIVQRILKIILHIV